jgi:hypothetical protein
LVALIPEGKVSLERLEVGVDQVLLGDGRREVVAGVRLAALGGVLHRCDHKQFFQNNILALG